MKLRFGRVIAWDLQPGLHFRLAWPFVMHAVNGGDMEGVGEAVEGEGAGERDHVPAVDQPPAEAAHAFGVLVEMNTRRVLIEAAGAPCSVCHFYAKAHQSARSLLFAAAGR